MPTATAERPSVQDALSTISQAHQATRAYTAPPFVGGAVVFMGSVLHYAWVWFAVLVWVGGLVLVVTGYDHSLRIKHRRERWWAAGTVTALAAGGAWWTIVGPLWGPALGVELFVTGVVALPCAIPWSLHRRVRRGVQVDYRIRAFTRDVLDRCNLKDVEAPTSTGWAEEHRWEVDLVPPAGWTLKKLQAAVPALAAELGLDESKVTIVRKEGRKGKRLRGRLMVDESDRAPAPTRWQLPAEPTDIRQPYRKGEITGGGELRGQWWIEDHGAVGGIVGGLLGSGKTVNAEADCAYLVTSFNALGPWIWDGKPGSPNWAQWGPQTDGLPALSDWYATKPDEFRMMVLACWAIAGTRGGTSEHEPTHAEPFVGMYCDESAIVFAPDTMTATVLTAKDSRKASQLAEEVRLTTEQYVQVYRSTATALRMATVRCEHKSTGGATLRSFLLGAELAGFATSNPRDGEFLFPGHDIALHQIPRDAPGTGYFQSKLHPTPVRGRVDLFDDKKIKAGHPDSDVQRLRRWVRDHPEASPALDDRVLQAIRSVVGDAYDRRNGRRPAVCPSCSGQLGAGDRAAGGCLACGADLEPDDTPEPAPPLVPVPEPAPEPSETVGAAPQRYASREHARQHALDALCSLGDGWHSAAAVRDVLGEHKAQVTITNRLGELREVGAVESRGRRERTEWRALRRTLEGSE